MTTDLENGQTGTEAEENVNYEDLVESLLSKRLGISDEDIVPASAAVTTAPDPEPIVAQEVVADPPAVQAEPDLQDKAIDKQSEWYNSLPDDVKQQLGAIEHELKSNRERVRRLNEKGNAHRRREEELLAALNKAGSAKVQLPESFQTAKGIDPQTMQGVQDAIESVDAAFNERLRAVVTPLIDSTAQERLEVEREKLVSAFPHYEQIVSSDEYKTWLGFQSEGLRKTHDSVQDADMAIAILTKFNNDYNMFMQQQARIGEVISGKSAPSVADTKATERLQADRVAEARKRTLTQTAIASAPAPVVVPDTTLEDYENLVENKIRARFFPTRR